MFVAVVSGTMINVALPFIGQHFETGKATYGWVVTGYTLTFGIFAAIHGRLADVYGIRRLYLLGLIIFGATAIFVALSPSIGVAIALRIFQGSGAAALPALGTTIITKILPANRRGAAMGFMLGTVGVAASIGPFLGGLLLEVFNWRAVFLFSALALFAVPAVLRLLPKHLDDTVPQRFDLVGAVLLGIGASALMFSFNLLTSRGFGIEFAGVLGGSITVLGLFVVWIRRSGHPFVQPELFKDMRFVASLSVAALVNATRFGTIVLVPILLVDIERTSALMIGAVLFPGAVFIAVLSPPAGRWADRSGARRPTLLGVIFILIAILVTSASAGQSIVGVTVGMSLYGLGFSLVQSPLTSATSQVLPPAQTGVGMGLFMMVFFLGGAFGVAFTLTAVELQSATASSWLGLELGRGAPFSNAILCLFGLGLLALMWVPKVPGVVAKPH